MKIICCAVFHTNINCSQNGIENQNDKVSVWAHMFGCLAGVMFGLVLLKDSREEVSKMDVVKQYGLSQSQFTKSYHFITCGCVLYGQQQQYLL